MSGHAAELHAIRAALVEAVSADASRRRRRRRAARNATLALAAVIALCGAALAAGDVLGVVNLGDGLQAQQVETYPAYDVATHSFVQAHGDFIYHVTGGRVKGLSACPTHANDIYIESTGPLTAAQLKIAAELANGGGAPAGLAPGQAWQAVPGLKSVSDGCGDAGVEAIVGNEAALARAAARYARGARAHRSVSCVSVPRSARPRCRLHPPPPRGSRSPRAAR